MKKDTKANIITSILILFLPVTFVVALAILIWDVIHTVVNGFLE